MTGLPVGCSAEIDTSALGAAVIAAALAESCSDLAGLASELAKEGSKYEPGTDREQYARLLDEYRSSLPVSDT